MESKKIISSGAKSKRSNIPVLNKEERLVKGTMGNLPRNFNRQSSKSELVKTAIVKPFNFTADTTDHQSDPVCNSSEVNSTKCFRKTNETYWSPQKETNATELYEKEMASLTPVRNVAHSGIQFCVSARKRTGPIPFKFDEKRELQKSDVSCSKGHASSAAAEPTNKKVVPLRRRIPPRDAKPKAPLKEGESKDVVQQLADMNKTVLEDSPVELKAFSGHSGVPFKTRKFRSQANPFARNDKEVRSIPPLHGEGAEK